MEAGLNPARDRAPHFHAPCWVRVGTRRRTRLASRRIGQSFPVAISFDRGALYKRLDELPVMHRRVPVDGDVVETVKFPSAPVSSDAVQRNP